MTVKSCSLDLLCIAGDGDADIHSQFVANRLYWNWLAGSENFSVYGK